MATGTVSRMRMGIAQGGMGKNVGDGTALSVTLGFRPARVVLLDATGNKKFEKFDLMPDTDTFDGTAVTTTSDIVLTERGFICSAAVNAAGKTLYWDAH